METWSLTFTDWDPKEQGLRESLLTLGNGYFATRGAFEESSMDGVNYPGTYLAGGYNHLTTVIEGQPIDHEDLVNLPNWLSLSFRFSGESWFDLKDVRIISFNQQLDLKAGELKRTIHFSDSKERETILDIRRIVSMDNPHVGAISWSIEAVNWNSTIEVQTFLDGGVKNCGVNRYRGLKNKHLDLIWGDCNLETGIYVLESQTSSSKVTITQAIRVEIFSGNQKVPAIFQSVKEPSQIGLKFDLQIETRKKITIEKVMSLFNSRDKAISNPRDEALHLVKILPKYEILYARHSRQWKRLWGMCDIELEEKIRETRLLRFHIFHLLQTVSLNSIHNDQGVPARGWHGEAYRGHIFWDEIFILPFLNLRLPEISKSLLMYRYHRLPRARENAAKEGFKGALFPWQSAGNGEEESQTYHLNPTSGRWIQDLTQRQRHINGAIVYNIWQYFQATGDKEFLSQFGIEMALEISRFWISLLTYDPQRKKYFIFDVVGPDEFHTGVNNNAYTNYMASWSIRITVEMFLQLTDDRQTEILDFLELTRSDLSKWYECSRSIYIPLRHSGVIDQFDGFKLLKNLDFDYYKMKYGNIQRIDRILEREGLNVNDYKVIKQPDVLMLYFLFSVKELESGFRWLGYPFQEKWIYKNIHYYSKISTHGSTLSGIVHAWIMSKFSPEKSWKLFSRALETDVADLQGGTTAEGIHLGAMAGTVDLIQRCFTGIELEQDILWINPRFPTDFKKVRFMIHFRGHAFEISVEDTQIIVNVKKSVLEIGKLGFNGAIYPLKEGEQIHLRLPLTNASITQQTFPRASL